MVSPGIPVLIDENDENFRLLPQLCRGCIRVDIDMGRIGPEIWVVVLRQQQRRGQGNHPIHRFAKAIF
jgi:hypothetical protein